MLSTYIKGEINNSCIYIQVNTAIIESLFNILYDNGYKVTSCTEDIWDANIEYGTSYTVDTLEELTLFETYNIKAKEITYGN